MSKHRLYFTPQDTSLVQICWRLSGPQGSCMREKEIGHLKISKDPAGDPIRNLRSCGAVPQPTAPLAVHLFLLLIANNFRLLAYLKSVKKRTQCVTIPCICSLSYP